MKLVIAVVFCCLLNCSCTTGKLKVIANMPSRLNENSALETSTKSPLIWTIEDSNNANVLYGLDSLGTIKASITITNAVNRDWEDLTSDSDGNIYIGDFGNNDGDRNEFFIYKVQHYDFTKNSAIAETTRFKLPKKISEENFEAFVLIDNTFYLFGKSDDKAVLVSVPNKTGKQEANFLRYFNLKGKGNKVTAADLSDDGKTLVLLNHDKLWKITNFKEANFFEANIDSLNFDHRSQKEGLCFKTDSILYISDEKSGGNGGNLYEFNLY